MKKYTQFTQGEITIYCGEEARHTVAESLKQARAISHSSRNEKILYINTVFSTRRVLGAARQVFASELVSQVGFGDRIILKTVVIGDLCNQLPNIQEMIDSHDIKHVIINSWEFANRSYAFKERTLFALAALRELGISVLIYSQAPFTSPGEICRGGLGKLAVIADDIIQLEESFTMDEDHDGSSAEILPQKSAHRHSLNSEKKILLASEINELDYARKEMEVASGGEMAMKEVGAMEEEMITM
ncbi:MAG: hypothetical protein Q8916_05640 [Bacteroidota bacterium]|nr:hypothetical protein [Bacteroidota bacterium]